MTFRSVSPFKNVSKLLGAKITHARNKIKLKQKDLAGKLGCTQGAVSQWEKGLTTPDGGHLLGIAKETGMPVDWFLDDSLSLDYLRFGYKAGKPMTDEEILAVWNDVIKYAPGEIRIKDFARAIEAAHGIGDKE